MGMPDDDVTEEQLGRFLSRKEHKHVGQFRNAAKQLIDRHAQDPKALRKLKLIDDFRHVEMQRILNEFYTLQGQYERIKKFPLPR